MTNQIQFLIYSTARKNEKINVAVKDETIWLSQKLMAAMFDCSADNIYLHLKSIYEEGELDENSTTEDFSVVQKEGNRSVNRIIRYYNLDVIISVGYRFADNNYGYM